MNLFASRQYFAATLFILSIGLLFHAPDALAQLHSFNGAGVYPHGELRILVIYVEIEYNDESKNVTTQQRWPRGFVPRKADWLFDSEWSETPQGEMTKYFSDMSMGEFRVLGDHLRRPVVIREDDVKNLGSHREVARAVAERINASSTKFKTSNKNLKPEDFDLWSVKGTGKAAEQGPNKAFDHVMIIVRNWKNVWWSEGHPNYGLTDSIFGHGCDGWISYNTLSFDIIKHEFGHFLLGGNNFHCCGGHDNLRFASYFMAPQGGWGLMGNAGSSLKTVNAMERRRLGWKHPDKNYLLSTGIGEDERPSDLDALNPDHSGEYVLRDFITTGDALRIKLPFLPEDEFPQWLWLENHQGITEFDNHDNVNCQAGFQPGIYAYIQCAKDDTAGRQTFRGHADYMMPLPAMGLFDIDIQRSPERLADQCVWNGQHSISEDHYPVSFEVANPLSGYSDLQHIQLDENSDGTIGAKERFTNHTDLIQGKQVNQWAFRGHPRHAFHLGGNRLMSIGSNPSTASHLTMLNTDKQINASRSKEKDNRTVYLNGIRIELISRDAESGAITVRVEFDKPVISQATRWSADRICLPNLAAFYELPENGYSLVIEEGASLTLDRGSSPTRLTDPDTVGTKVYLNDDTHWVIDSNARVLVKSILELRNNSVIELLPGAIIELESARLLMQAGSKIILHPGAEVITDDASEWKFTSPDQVIRLPEKD